MSTDDDFLKAIEEHEARFEEEQENLPEVEEEEYYEEATDDVVILIDADSILYKVCCTNKAKGAIRSAIKSEIKYIQRQCKSKNIQVAVKGKGNFRYKVFNKYKSNRPPMDEDFKKTLNYAHDWFYENFPVTKADGMEADDLVSIWAWEAHNNSIPFIIAHIDKDLDQIPGDHFNFNKKLHYRVSVLDGYNKLIEQWITGDSADGIPGLKGYGPAKAKKVMAGVPLEKLEETVRSLYKREGKSEEYCQQMYDCVYMLQTWDELYVHEPSLKPEADISQQDVLSDETKDSGLQELPE